MTENRAPLFREAASRRRLRDAIAACRRDRPFELIAIVLLEDHLHLMMGLPAGDGDFSTRLASIKAHFTRDYLMAGGAEEARGESRVAHRNRGVWQRRFWEHLIRDEADFNRHADYIHYNPVKHRLATCPHTWAHSSFERWVKRNAYEPDWLCTCDGRRPVVPDFTNLAAAEMD